MDSHSLIQALIYLGAAALIVPIAVRLGLGSVLGYLIAGCIIGPWGLRLVTDAESILHFAEIGVVLMLFVIGLELDPRRLWTLRASVFGGGALQMGICGLLLGGFCIALGLAWPVALLIGLTLGLSSTAIAMQAMNERGSDGFANGTQRLFGAAVPGHCRYPAGGNDPAAGQQRCEQPPPALCAFCAESRGRTGAGGAAWPLSGASGAALCCPLWFT